MEIKYRYPVTEKIPLYDEPDDFSCNPEYRKIKIPLNISLFRSKYVYLHQFQEQSEVM